MTAFLHYAWWSFAVVWAMFGAAELVLFVASAFIPPTEYEWDEEDERLL